MACTEVPSDASMLGRAELISLSAWIARHMRCWPCAFGVGFAEGLGEVANLPVGACVGMGNRQPGSAQERRTRTRTTPLTRAPEQMSLWGEEREGLR